MFRIIMLFVQLNVYCVFVILYVQWNDKCFQILNVQLNSKCFMKTLCTVE